MKARGTGRGVSATLALACGIAAGRSAAVADTDSRARLPDAVSLPAPVACSFRETDWESEPFVLELNPGVPFAWVGRADKIEVTYPVATKAVPLGVNLVVGGVRLAGLVPASTFPLHLTQPLVVNEIFSPSTVADLRWQDASVGSVGVELDFPSTPIAVRNVQGTLRFRRSCKQVGIGVAEFETIAGKHWRSGKRRCCLKAMYPIPISAQRMGPPLATLIVVDAAHSEVLPLDADEQWSRIAVNVNHVDVVGWVRNEHLTGHLGLYNSDDRFTKLLEPRRTGNELVVSCEREIPLIAKVRGERRVVGAVAAGVVMLARPTPGEFVPVKFVKAPVQPADRTSFLVRRTDVRACAGFR